MWTAPTACHASCQQIPRLCKGVNVLLALASRLCLSELVCSRSLPRSLQQQLAKSEGARGELGEKLSEVEERAGVTKDLLGEVRAQLEAECAARQAAEDAVAARRQAGRAVEGAPLNTLVAEARALGAAMGAVHQFALAAR